MAAEFASDSRIRTRKEARLASYMRITSKIVAESAHIAELAAGKNGNRLRIRESGAEWHQSRFHTAKKLTTCNENE